jgi:hypothetical protein
MRSRLFVIDVNKVIADHQSTQDQELLHEDVMSEVACRHAKKRAAKSYIIQLILRCYSYMIRLHL